MKIIVPLLWMICLIVIMVNCIVQINTLSTIGNPQDKSQSKCHAFCDHLLYNPVDKQYRYKYKRCMKRC
uniref:Hypotheticial protein n=1 Tax=Schistosoma mansoni TaxID=6183 RepID=A0A5K4F790_SCHMA